MLCSSCFISGWRATDSIYLPKMIPMPIPAPIEPRPAPTPSAIALPASVMPVSVMPAASVVKDPRSTGSSLVFLGGRAADVDGCQGREDEGLQGGHQPDLEQEERDRHQQREDAERSKPQQDDQAAGHEQDQQVAGEDVREESYGQRD